MGLYKLNYKKKDLSDGVLEGTNKKSVDYEKDFENWLENSPHVLFEDDFTTVMWIGRQVTATNDKYVRYPDLLGINANGDLVIVELKKGKTPREVVAQILEYAAWSSNLNYKDLNTMAIKYYENDSQFESMELYEIFNTIFYPDNNDDVEIKFNTSQKLFIIAEEITATVKEVVKYLNRVGGLDIICIEYDVYKTETGDFFIGTEKIEDSKEVSSKAINVNTDGSRWNEDIKVRDVIKKAVLAITKGEISAVFTPKEVINLVLQKYPDFNKSTARCQIIQDCVNHSSRRHYKGGQQDLYFLIDKGHYRLYDVKKDGSWNWEGKRIN